MFDVKPSRNRSVLTNGKLLLRPLRLSDSENLFLAVRESLAELSHWMPWARQNYSLGDSKAFLKKRPVEWKDGISYGFAILDKEEMTHLGGCGINFIQRENGVANLGYWVRSSCAGKGIATAASALLGKWGFKKLGLNRLEIIVAVENIRSQRVAEKLGAKREGVLRNRLYLNGNIHDAIMYSLIPQDL